MAEMRTERLQEMLGSVMNDPKFAGMVQALQAQMGGEGENLAGVMDKLPQLMTMLAPMLQANAPTPDTAQGGTTTPDIAQGGTTTPDIAQENAPVQDTVRAHMPLQDAVSGKGILSQGLGSAADRDQRNKLLSALKPYLSPARRSMIDRAMSAMQLGELLGTMSGLGTTSRLGTMSGLGTTDTR